MEYVCLAAGKGSRFGRLGTYLQKCMYPIDLRPFLEHTLRQWLEGAAVDATADRLTLVVGHHAQQLRVYFGDSFEGVPLRYVNQEEQRGTGHALGLAAGGLREEHAALVWLADLFVTADVFQRVLGHPAETLVTLAPGPEGDNERVRVRRAGDRMARVWEGDEPLYDVGLWKLPVTVMRDLRRVRTAAGEFRVLPNLQQHVDDGLAVGWLEIGSWVHLGGTDPTPEENVRRVVDRVRAVSR
jgi:UDP-N-acetylglucosamine diphosphorylase / glucose-1-phosphate thymidylyltransferase / UDP-N-acetylgalactosamine diphosphorylase / glucosamine-1-phosphate N-acetyltransferase / galactosamine-1-phosphate N-acetyltransferase